MNFTILQGSNELFEGHHLNPKSILHTNLCLLGFHHQTLTDNKWMEQVFYFLFSKINQRDAKLKFHSCWPVYDKQQAREFRNITFKWLAELKKDGHLSKDIPIRRSFLDECRGDRFIRLLLETSTLVVKLVLQNERKKAVKNKDASVRLSTLSNSACEEKFRKILKVQIIRQTRKFLIAAAQHSKEQHQWKKLSNILLEKYKDQLKENVQAERKLALFKSKYSSELKSATSQLQTLSKQISATHEKWNLLQNWKDQKSPVIDFLEGALKDSSHTNPKDLRLKESLGIQLSEKIKRNWEHKILNDQIQLYSLGNLDLAHFLILSKLGLVSFGFAFDQRRISSTNDILYEYKSVLKSFQGFPKLTVQPNFKEILTSCRNISKFTSYQLKDMSNFEKMLHNELTSVNQSVLILQSLLERGSKGSLDKVSATPFDKKRQTSKYELIPPTPKFELEEASNPKCILPDTVMVVEPPTPNINLREKVRVMINKPPSILSSSPLNFNPSKSRNSSKTPLPSRLRQVQFANENDDSQSFESDNESEPYSEKSIKCKYQKTPMRGLLKSTFDDDLENMENIANDYSNIQTPSVKEKLLPLHSSIANLIESPISLPRNLSMYEESDFKGFTPEKVGLSTPKAEEPIPEREFSLFETFENEANFDTPTFLAKHASVMSTLKNEFTTLQTPSKWWSEHQPQEAITDEEVPNMFSSLADELEHFCLIVPPSKDSSNARSLHEFEKQHSDDVSFNTRDDDNSSFISCADTDEF